jgi:hypothetical protein
MDKRHKKYLMLAAIVLMWAGWGLLLYVTGPEKLVDFFGMRNSYAIAFTLAVLGGVSSFTAGPFYATIIALGAGGADIGALSLIAGTGLAISDSIFYLFGIQGRKTLSVRPSSWTSRLAEWVHQKPKWTIPLLTFLYVGVAPLPNDLLMVTLATAKYPYKKIFPAILFGDITAVLLLAALAQSGSRWLR